MEFKVLLQQQFCVRLLGAQDVEESCVYVPALLALMVKPQPVLAALENLFPETVNTVRDFLFAALDHVYLDVCRTTPGGLLRCLDNALNRVRVKCGISRVCYHHDHLLVSLRYPQHLLEP